MNDPEGQWVPPSAPRVIDAHVHIFPDDMFQAIWKWFDQYAWPVRYRMSANELAQFLLKHGVSHFVALHYAHRVGVARGLNRFMCEMVDVHPHMTGTATVFPGEPNGRKILEEAFAMGLRGVKLHAHVQYFDMSDDGMREIYETCSEHDQPLVMHVGPEPTNPHFPYERDPAILCRAEKLEPVLASYPDLRICVPHLGADEFVAYHQLVQRYDNLWVDVAMALADYLPVTNPMPLRDWRSDRIMYGSDFPNIPYAWDRELKRLVDMQLPSDALDKICWKNAAEFFSLPLDGTA